MARLRLEIEIPDETAGGIKALKKFGVDWKKDLVVQIERIVEKKRTEYLQTLQNSLEPEESSHGVITAAKVRAIRLESKSGMGYGALAERWGVSKSCIQQIVTRRTWKEVE